MYLKSYKFKKNLFDNKIAFAIYSAAIHVLEITEPWKF